MASDTYSAGGGPIAAVVNAAWATAPKKPSALDWLPDPSTPIYPGGPPFNVRWWRFFRELASKAGGLSGLSITDVASSVTLVQDQVLQATTAATNAATQVAANTASIDAIREVAVNAGLPGSGQIP